MTEFRPIAVLLANFIVGFLVTQGYIDPVHADVVTQTITEAAGLSILLATSVYSLHRYVHLHPRTETVTTTQTVETVKSPVIDQVPTETLTPPTQVPTTPSEQPETMVVGN